ncbi:ribosome bioproteinsis protein ytm1 [Purpureocillium takamizusanense]|uniref:Ribosome bioproteinsis protein ytm1 n=1 Tax=Purpureocillium takamizusanense TaxID=2060973 RepID=A0A9Q8VC94_9HYPO|nr:ribosome biogenesis protein ytm1 [Purpureocillium takamizusanense]UNI19654.1 ribosome bioproteinsis protein ytm1 [Purpureocillium takamizusanense]
MATAAQPQRLSDAILGFALDSKFPDNIAELPPVSDTDLQPAIDSLARTTTELETEIHIINEETKDDVSSWVRNAKTLQEDIIRSKAIANDIIRQSEAPDVSGEVIAHAESKAEFLNREVQYTQQLSGVLHKVCRVNQLLSDVEIARNERRILNSLHLLEQSWAALDDVGVSKACRILRLLDVRAFELKSDVHEVFDQVWKALVRVDVGAGTVAIYDKLEGDPITLSEAVIGLKAYKEVDERMEQLWRNIDAALITPRMNTTGTSFPVITAGPDELALEGRADPSIDALFADLEKVLVLLAHKLPSDLLESLSAVMMGEIVPRLIQQWLNPAVPTSLADMSTFQDMVRRTAAFCSTLRQNGYTGYEKLSNWADKAHMTWLEKRRENTLDMVRRKLTSGIGQSRQVEKVEKHMVSLSEGKELATTGAGAAADTNDWGDDWGDAWGDDDDAQGANVTTAKAEGAPVKIVEDDGTDAWGWDEEESGGDAAQPADADADDSAAAWGWGNEEPASELPATQAKARGTASKGVRQEGTRELVLRETYNISSMPEPVLELIYAILEDGAALTKTNDEYNLVASTAPGLFGLPTLALALFRAISPYYYSLGVGGNMFLYNDAMYIAERLSHFSAAWKEREDLTPRAKTMLRLDNDIKTLQSFANRSYGAEMNLQKTVLQDLLGGLQSLLQQDDMEAAVEAGTARVRTMAATWEPILARSVWSQAIGSLADALATRLITDVLDMPAIGQEEAYSIAKLIASATELDDLFLPSKLGGTEPSQDEVPATAQYAPNWLRLKYLSEVLQSNLNEVKFLWCDSELSLYFTVDEVMDLINASFEDNARTRETIREIQGNPKPMDAVRQA